MKKILFPVDVSQSSQRIYDYAMHLAEDLATSVHLLYVCNGETSTDLPVFEKSMPSYQSSSQALTGPPYLAKKRLNTLGQTLSEQDWEVGEITTEIVTGKPEEEILYASNRMNPDLILMGTRGTSKVYKTFGGSTTAYVMEKAKYPVLSFPINYTYKGLQRILYASNFDESDHYSLEKLFGLTSHLNPEIYVIHLISSQTTCTDSLRQYLRHKLQQHVSYRFPMNHIKVDVRCTDCPQQELINAIREYDIQLLATTTHSRKFDQQYNNPSFTKNLLYNLKLPLIAFHENEKKFSPDFYEDYY